MSRDGKELVGGWAGEFHPHTLEPRRGAAPRVVGIHHNGNGGQGIRQRQCESPVTHLGGRPPSSTPDGLRIPLRSSPRPRCMGYGTCCRQAGWHSRRSTVHDPTTGLPVRRRSRRLGLQNRHPASRVPCGSHPREPRRANARRSPGDCPNALGSETERSKDPRVSTVTLGLHDRAAIFHHDSIPTRTSGKSLLFPMTETSFVQIGEQLNSTFQ